MTQRVIYECPSCHYTWGRRFPLEELIIPLGTCPKCGERSAPKGSLARKTPLPQRPNFSNMDNEGAG